MNILNIAFKEIKQDFRDIRTLALMIALPIVLMLVLGTALSNTFTTTISVEEMNVLYKNTATNEISPYFDKFVKEVSKSDIHFIQASGDMDGKKEVKEINYDGYVEVNNSGITLYVNDRNSIYASIIQGMLSTFVDKYNVTTEIAKVAPEQLGTTSENIDQGDYIQETSLHSKDQPGSMDYYAIAMLTMIALYGAMSASYLLRGERLSKTADRLIAAPIRKSEIFVGKMAGNIVTNSLCAIVIILFSKFVFNVNWGDHPGIVFLVVFTEIILATSFGLGLSYLAKTEGVSTIIVTVVAQLASFFGGAYFKIEDADGLFKFATKLSPLTWENAAITKIIYANDLFAAIPAITLNLGISILFLLIAIISLTRREGL